MPAAGAGAGSDGLADIRRSIGENSGGGKLIWTGKSQFIYILVDLGFGRFFILRNDDGKPAIDCRLHRQWQPFCACPGPCRGFRHAQPRPSSIRTGRHGGPHAGDGLRRSDKSLWNVWGMSRSSIYAGWSKVVPSDDSFSSFESEYIVSPPASNPIDQ